MAQTFNFTGPDGSEYSLDGPDGATAQQAFAQLQAGIKAGKIQPTTPAVSKAASATAHAMAQPPQVNNPEGAQPQDSPLVATAKGVGDVVGTGALNMAHGAAAGLEYLGRMILGGPGGPGSTIQNGEQVGGIAGPESHSISDVVPQAHLGAGGQQVGRSPQSPRDEFMNPMGSSRCPATARCLL